MVNLQKIWIGGITCRILGPGRVWANIPFDRSVRLRFHELELVEHGLADEQGVPQLTLG
jgi:hypothetical protein